MTRIADRRPDVREKAGLAGVTHRQQLANIAVILKRNAFFRVFVLYVTAHFVLMSFFLNSILENQNYLEIFPQELVLPTVMHAVTAVIITCVIYWLPWLRSFATKLCSVVILALSMVGYDSNLQAIAGPIRAFVPGLSDADSLSLVSLIYLLMLVVIAVLIGMGMERIIKRLTRIRPEDVMLGVLVLVAYIFLLPAYSVAKVLPVMIQETGTQAPEFSGQKSDAPAEEKPDIYYIVLDRYANADVLSRQFDYDNSPFTSFLNDKGFRVNDNASSNYPYTAMSVASTINAQYTNELVAPYKDKSVQDRTLYHNLIWRSSVVKALKKGGYKYHAVGSWYGSTYKAPLADVDYMQQQKVTVFGMTKRLRGIEIPEFVKSPYFRFAQLPGVSWWPLQYTASDPIENTRQQLATLDELTTKGKPGGRFIFAHILVPHEPFAFNADGSLSLNPAADNTGVPIKEKYLGQVQFINTQMKTLVENIQKQSKGKAVVIFNADEGPYPEIMNSTFKQPLATDPANAETAVQGRGSMGDWSDEWIKMKYGILQAAHIPKATEEDLSHLSSVNVFRIILNRYAGYDLDYLPECHFGLNNGNQMQYNYADITGRFIANPDARCGQLQSLPGK